MAAIITDPGIKLLYEWVLDDIEEHKSYLSKMILFRGQRVFRVCLNNLGVKPTLSFVAINLNKMGMHAVDVHYYIQDVNRLTRMKNSNPSDQDGNLQLFTSCRSEAVIGKCTFVFHIYIDGLTYTDGLTHTDGFTKSLYCYRLSDRLVKEQLWEAVVQNQHWTDVKLVTKGKTFSAHKSILAARSPVFAAEFAEEQPEKPDCCIVMDDVDLSSVEQFLHFIYTGELITPMLDNKGLLKLANRYQLTNLEKLCQYAFKKSDAVQMAHVVSLLHPDENAPHLQIRSNKDTEIFFDGSSSYFQCQSLNSKDNDAMMAMNEFQHEKLFFARWIGDVSLLMTMIMPLIHLICPKHQNFGLKIAEIKYYIQSIWKENCECTLSPNNWKMKSILTNDEILLFTAKSDFELQLNDTEKCVFEIQLVQTIENYRYEMVDTDWIDQLWNAAINEKLTDVDVFLGDNKVMEAHRVVLSARSPVMDTVLTKINNTGRSTICITSNSITDVEIVMHFLRFLYTGSLTISAINDQLLELAETFEIKTLKKICQLANRIPDADALTNSLFDL